MSEATDARDTDRKSWELEKSKLDEERENLKSKLLSLSAEKLKVYNQVLELKKDLEAAKSSEKNNVKMEMSLNELKKEVNTERDKCKKLQEELSMSSERESKMSKNFASVSWHEFCRLTKHVSTFFYRKFYLSIEKFRRF